MPKPLHFRELLRDHREPVIQRWEAAVRVIPAARRLDRAALRDGMPRVLDEVAEEVGRYRDGVALEAPAEHTEQRWYHGFTLDEIVAEYAWLRDAVMVEWDVRAEGAVPADEAGIFHRAIDRAILHAVVAYTGAHRAAQEEHATLAGAIDFPEWLQDVVNQAPMSIAVLDIEGRHVLVNEIWSAQTGKRPDEATGRTPFELWGTPASAEATSLQIEAIRTGRGVATTEYSHSEDGRIRHYRWALLPVPGPGGTPFGGVAFTWDVTAEVDTALQRDLALLHEREEAAMRERFVHVLAHDLRSPLQAMAVSAELLVSQPDAADQVERLATRLAGSVGKMTRLVDELLELARAEHPDGMRLHLHVEDVGVVIAEAIEALFPRPEGRPRMTVERGPCMGLIDADRLTQALENLIVNAHRHGAGTPVSVAVRRDDEAITIAVHNEGPTIDPEDIPHIFEPYRRARLASKVPGLGLGLYIVEAIVTAHGGTVDARSVPGDGTTFTIRLPASV